MFQGGEAVGGNFVNASIITLHKLTVWRSNIRNKYNNNLHSVNRWIFYNRNSMVDIPVVMRIIHCFFSV